MQPAPEAPTSLPDPSRWYVPGSLGFAHRKGSLLSEVRLLLGGLQPKEADDQLRAGR